MTTFNVKASESFCTPGKLYAEEEGNPDNWRWLTEAELQTMTEGASFSQAAELVAADDGMQAAIGAAHFEDKNHNGIDDAVEGYTGPDTEVDTTTHNVGTLPDGKNVVMQLELDTAEGKEKVRATMLNTLNQIIDSPDYPDNAGFAIITLVPNTDGSGEQVQGWMGNLSSAAVISVAASRDPTALLGALFGAGE